jgi:hypothetical protein
VNTYENKVKAMTAQFKATYDMMLTEMTEEETIDAEKLDDETVDALWRECCKQARLVKWALECGSHANCRR